MYIYIYTYFRFVRGCQYLPATLHSLSPCLCLSLCDILGICHAALVGLLKWHLGAPFGLLSDFLITFGCSHNSSPWLLLQGGIWVATGQGQQTARQLGSSAGYAKLHCKCGGKFICFRFFLVLSFSLKFSARCHFKLSSPALM